MAKKNEVDVDMEVTEETHADARNLANSMRGNFIMAKALYHGIKSLDQVEGHMKETSDLEDMKFLFTNLFPGLGSVIAAQYDPEHLLNTMNAEEE
tara:strand:- start:461 stop:745 length:285 start_codon:yes stop_codon:yes gene_type:complete